jgi:hypothetical protein
LFYAVAGFLCLSFRKNRKAGAFLAAGAVFHAGLIAYGYAVAGLVCPACWKFAAMDTLLAVLYWVLPEWRPMWAAYVSGGPARALAVAALALFLASPQTGQPLPVPGSKVESRPAIADTGNKTGSIPATGTVQKAAPLLSAAGASPCHLQVSTPDGRSVCLDLKQKPALFFAVWCPHCDGALQDAAQMESKKRPYLVVTYLRDGDAEKVKDKLAKNGLSGEVYYLAEKTPAGVQGVPVLVHWDGKVIKFKESGINN